MKKLLIASHAPSDNTRLLSNWVVVGPVAGEWKWS